MILTVPMQKILSLGMFDLRTELYLDSVARLPDNGQHIIGYQDETTLVVYQAYKKSIVEFLPVRCYHLTALTSVIRSIL